MVEDQGSGLTAPSRTIPKIVPGFGLGYKGDLFEGLRKGDVIEINLENNLLYGRFIEDEGALIVYEDWGIDHISLEKGPVFRIDTDRSRLPKASTTGCSKITEEELKRRVLRFTQYSDFIGKFVEITSPSTSIIGRLAQISPPFYQFNPSVTTKYTPYGSRMRLTEEGEYVEVHGGIIANGVAKPITLQDLEALVERSKIELAKKNSFLNRLTRKLF